MLSLISSSNDKIRSLLQENYKLKEELRLLKESSNRIYDL